MKNDFDLACIRTGTDHDLADAMALASRLLDKTSDGLDFATRQFSFDLLVAVLMSTAYGTRDKTLDEVLFFLSDPAWASPQQLLWSFGNEIEAWKQPRAAKWCGELAKTLGRIDASDEVVAAQIKRC